MKPALLRIAVLAVALLFVSTGCGRDSSYPLPPAGFKVRFGEQKIPTEMVAGETVSADVSFTNTSERIWPSKPNEDGKNAVNLSYHWVDRDNRMLVSDGLRTPLPRDLDPGNSITLKATIQAPPKPGKYTLQVTLVQEGVAWFPENGGEQLALPVNVVSR